MSDGILNILDWLTENPAIGLLVASIVLLGLIVLAFILIIAFAQGREISVGSFKIDQRSAPKSGTRENNVAKSTLSTEREAATQASENVAACVNTAGFFEPSAFGRLQDDPFYVPFRRVQVMQVQRHRSQRHRSRYQRAGRLANLGEARSRGCRGRRPRINRLW